MKYGNFLEYLAIERHVAATQNQALNPNVFLSFIGFATDHLRPLSKISAPCISPTRLLHSTHEQLDGVPVISG